MTQKEMMELVKQHHPQMSDKQVRIYLNTALKDFTRKTKILESAFQFTTVEDQRYYEIPDNIIQIQSVDVENEVIPRLISRPGTRDLT